MSAAVATLAFLAPVLGPLHAQASAAIGTLEGRDASVEHSAASAANTAAGTSVGNGSVVVVHSGKAHLQLTGSAISVCGPAKFTVLQSGDALTLALEFGTLRISLQNTTPLETYTPFFTALPESTEGGNREFTIGLDANGIFCARAIHGGVKLEQQLTGHWLVVPEPSETFLRGGDMTPLRDPPGHCECAVTLADVAPSSPPSVETANAAPGTEHAPTDSANSAAPVGPAVAATPPATGSSSSPSPAPLATSTAPPATSATASGAAKVTMPPLAFDYSSRNTVPIANSDTAALLDDSRMTPGWVFSGHVGKGSSPAAASLPRAHDTAHNAAQAPPAQEHVGFWSKLKHFFGGGKNNGS
jgi:hypothetical protein